MGKYDDIIFLPYPRPGKRARMSMTDRGAQFSPFAALTGYDAAIREQARLTGERVELTEGEQLLLNETLQEILSGDRQAAITWFRPDGRKAGGTYEREVCRIRKPEPYGRGLVLEDGRLVPYADILALEVL